MSGIGWYGDLGNFLVMPTTGELHTFKGTEENPESGYRSRYSHDREVAKVDGYSVMLDDYGIQVELAAASRSGMMRFTYPQSEVSRIQIDLARRIGGTSTEQYVEVVDDYTIKGWMKCTPDGGGWGDGAGQGNYTAYFYCCFDRPLKILAYGVRISPREWNVRMLPMMIRLTMNISRMLMYFLGKDSSRETSGLLY